MPELIRAEALKPKDALTYWSKKMPLSTKDFYRLTAAAKTNAFNVSGVTQMDMLTDISDSLKEAMETGMTFDQWKDTLSDTWDQLGWTGEKAYRLDNIFRTNLQTAFSVGRYKQMMAVSESRPYWQYSAVIGPRTRPTHSALHEMIYPAGHSFWDSFYPPNGYRCRCGVKSLSARQVSKKGLKVQDKIPLIVEPIDHETGLKLPARPLLPDVGFDFNPGKAHYEPDLSKYPEELRAAFKHRLEARN